MLLETEIWFNLLAACQRKQIPVVLANARLSEKSARGYAKLGSLAQNALHSLHLIAAQTPNDAKRFQGLGAKRVETLGNLKFDALPPSDTLAKAEQWRSWFGRQRPVFLAASTREGEEELILDALAAAPISDLLTVIVPRHPQRFDEVADLLQTSGLPWQRRSQWPADVAHTAAPQEVGMVLGDSLGEMPLYYGVASVALLGGSFAPLGGQNLIEACACSCPVVMGPHTFNF